MKTSVVNTRLRDRKHMNFKLELTSTWTKELHNELIQSTKYCHFVLAFDPDDIFVKEYHHESSAHTINTKRSPSERHFGSQLACRKQNELAQNHAQILTRIQFDDISVYSSLPRRWRRHNVRPTSSNLSFCLPSPQATMDDNTLWLVCWRNIIILITWIATLRPHLSRERKWDHVPERGTLRIKWINENEKVLFSTSWSWKKTGKVLKYVVCTRRETPNGDTLLILKTFLKTRLKKILKLLNS